MRVVSFVAGGEVRVGLERAGRVFDLLGLGRRVLGAKADRLLSRCHDVVSLLEAGEPALEAARQVEAQAVQNPAEGYDTRQVALLAPVLRPQKLLCIGQNYRDHCEEQNQPLPEFPVLFTKVPTAITHPGASIVLPEISQKVDFEGELCVVIGRQGRHIPRERAYEHVAGYTILNDVSARDIQKADGQWVRAKSFDTFAPLGPALVTHDEIGDPQALDLETRVNGQVMQKSNTRNLVFDVPYLVSYLSQVFTLVPGDLISTGTPGGVGVFRDPPVFLKAGDTVSITIDRIGTLTNPVVSA